MFSRKLAMALAKGICDFREEVILKRGGSSRDLCPTNHAAIRNRRPQLFRTDEGLPMDLKWKSPLIQDISVLLDVLSEKIISLFCFVSLI